MKKTNKIINNLALSKNTRFTFENTQGKPRRLQQKQMLAVSVDGHLKQEGPMFAVIIKFTQNGSEYQQW